MACPACRQVLKSGQRGLSSTRISLRTRRDLSRAITLNTASSSASSSIRSFSTSLSSRAAGKKKEDVRKDYNLGLSFLEEPDSDHVNYRRVTAADLASRRNPPVRVKMLVRDFIHDSLYNPNYGYFCKQATIFAPPKEGYDFASFRDQVAFQEAIGARYEKEYGDMMDGGLGRQVWHTPVELFSPHFSHALISAILSDHQARTPDSELVIYELGAGNGSFMLDSLSFLRERHPEIYARTKYRIVEISPVLAQRQRERARDADVRDRVEIIQSDIFNWKGKDDQACYVVALEVLDNFAHDMVRYDIQTLEPLQAMVVINPQGDFTLIYEPVHDPSLLQTLKYRSLLPKSSSSTPPVPSLLQTLPFLRKAYTELPFAPNLSKPDFIPTKAIMLLEQLRQQLPNHKLMVADFATLPDTLPGRNAPVVQTRLGKTMVPVETFLVKQGFFDIFFPTDFELLRDLYALMTSSPPDVLNHPDPVPAMSSDKHPDLRTTVAIHTQADFVRQHGGSELMKKLTTKDGGNLIQGMYGNAKIMF